MSRKLHRPLPLSVQQRLYDTLHRYHYALTARAQREAASEATVVLQDVATFASPQEPSA